MDYVQNLIDLVCGKTYKDGQIYDYISKMMRPQDDVENGGRYVYDSDEGVWKDTWEQNGQNRVDASSGRWSELKTLDPRYHETDKDDGTSALVSNGEGNDYIGINNNPIYPPNIIDRLNTPFDHIEKILFQDLSEIMFKETPAANYFRDLFSFKFKDGQDAGIAGFKMSDGRFPAFDDAQKSDIYGKINQTFADGEFFLDSFTYTPFIDYSLDGQGEDRRIGIYSDEFLTDYNTGKYEGDYDNIDAKDQFDSNRRKLSSTLFELRNLQKDVYDAKIKFREAIERTDSKTYIYTFCEHLASLFAKLSNIRMSHEIYGFKHPHNEWEGILALDVWYNLLYKEIDLDYGFNEDDFNMNPMAKKEIFTDENGDYVEYGVDRNGDAVRLHRLDPDFPEYLEWIDDDTVEEGIVQQTRYAYIWNDNLWKEYDSNSKQISENRKSCVTPRGVLSKMYEIVVEAGVPTGEILEMDGGDFPWFFQRGKVYSDAAKGKYTKYANLHLGRAYDVMSVEDYRFVTGQGEMPADGMDESGMYSSDSSQLISSDSQLNSFGSRLYYKPAIEDCQYGGIRQKMVEMGCLALEDAFSVVADEHLFNVFNSQTKQVEEFNPENQKYYSQAQCAVAIERVFSRIYKYLQFKSTTGEKFQRHINIDSGYKYLTTKTLLGSDNQKSNVYYSEQDSESGMVDYLRYLAKVKEYLDPFVSDIDEDGMFTVNGETYYFVDGMVSDSLGASVKVIDSKFSLGGVVYSISNGKVNFAYLDILTDEERYILSQFVSLLSEKASHWIQAKWNLCPLCQTQLYEMASRTGIVKVSRAAEGETVLEYEDDLEQEDEGGTTRNLYVYFNLENFMDWESNGMNVPQTCELVLDASNRPMYVKYSSTAENFRFDLSELNCVTSPSYTDSGSDVKVEYQLLGYSTDRFATAQIYSPDGIIQSNQFGESSNVVLYAVWKAKYIVKFDPGLGNGTREPFLADAGTAYELEKCDFTSPEQLHSPFTYYTSSNGTWGSVADEDQQEVPLYRCSGWEYVQGSSRVVIPDGGRFVVSAPAQKNVPVITLTAKWEPAYNVLKFTVDGEDYCDVLVPVEENKVVYPSIDPPLAGQRKFLGWSSLDGDYLPDTHSDIVICNSGGQTIGTVDDSGMGETICGSLGLYTYAVPIYARIAEVDKTKFNVTFKYIEEDGSGASKIQEVENGTSIPKFHIHLTAHRDGKDFVFRYWMLESGNLTSDLCVMSDCVFTAVYDEVESKMEYSPARIEPSAVTLIEPLEQDDEKSFQICEYLSTGLSLSSEHYCTKCGLDPLAWGDSTRSVLSGAADFSELGCPYVELLNRLKAEAPGDDFRQLTMLEIKDVILLVKALFKINFDIAHREYYLKIDVPEVSDWWYGYKDGEKWISFEPTVEFKFSNLHASNQVYNGRLICRTTGRSDTPHIMPVNRELYEEAGVHYSDLAYFYDYAKSYGSVWKRDDDADMVGGLVLRDVLQDDNQRYYDICPLCMYENSPVQSPVDQNGFVRHRLNPIDRSRNQVRTFTSIVKKYRPIVMPNVRDIFNDCINNHTKYEVDVNNEYGVFGWCSIPSKTMVNMEYNEQSIVVPSTYDHHNRVGGNNFLQMDNDLEYIYSKWQRTDEQDDVNRYGSFIQNVQYTWYYLYNQRDWTYFLQPFFGVKPNNELYTYLLETVGWKKLQNSDDIDCRPETSNHINGVIFEPSNEGRSADKDFGKIAETCQFIARHHHNENNLTILAERFNQMLSYKKLLELTSGGSEFNSVYGSKYEDLPISFKYPIGDWIDDYDKTGSYVGLEKDQYAAGDELAESFDSLLESSSGSFLESSSCGDLVNAELKYRYNLGQSHAIDDFDEDSVWFYITMVSPMVDLQQVVEIEDIMPFVFWWDNRGYENNGPTANCYGVVGNAKLNYELGGWCYSGAYDRQKPITSLKEDGSISNELGDEIINEEKWHAVQHTLGVDFSQKAAGGVILNTDNSGNVYKGAFDPHCSGTDEKWKIHDINSAFGTKQTEDIPEDKYYTGDTTHGGGQFNGEFAPSEMNSTVLNSINGRPMAWNLWNVVRHYAYIKYFKNKHRDLGSDRAMWQELETYTKKIVRAIYRTYQENKGGNFESVDGAYTNVGDPCLVKWTNSFVEISSILERNARVHQASFVLFTGDVRPKEDYTDPQNATYLYNLIRKSEDNFMVNTLNGVDSNECGMPVDGSGNPEKTYYNGFRFADLPPSYVLGDSMVYRQQLPDTTIFYNQAVDLDEEYPEAEYVKTDHTRKWVRKIYQSVINKQVFPVYTSMETMTKSHHDLTVDEMKSITFQVIPQLYWKYDWAYNDFMIHRVGKLNAPASGLPMYDMLGNVWELVRDDWTEKISDLDGLVNPIAVAGSITGSSYKVIKGGAFDQLIRKVISPSREKIDINDCKSEKYDSSTKGNVGFRPSLVYTHDGRKITFTQTKKRSNVDLFFLFDASLSQNNQIGDMIDSATNIIRQFAPTYTKTLSIDEQKEQLKQPNCLVGSALFLGPTIRLMCSKQYGTATYKQFVRDPRPEYDGKEFVHGSGFKGTAVEAMKNYNKVRKQYSDAKQLSARALEKKFTSKYNAIRNKYQSETASVDEESRGMVYQSEDLDFGTGFDFGTTPMLMSRADGGVGSTSAAAGSGSGTPVSDWTFKYFLPKTTLYAHHGVPVWIRKEQSMGDPEEGRMFFGDVAWDDQGYPVNKNGVAFFVFDPRSDATAKKNFIFPQIQAKKGALTNWFAGCEPVTYLMSKLLSNGLFKGFPYNNPIGYMFRDDSIPKYLFVYTNEFDNSLGRQTTTSGNSVVAIPGINDNTITFEPGLVKYTNLKGNNISEYLPPDQFCLEQLRRPEIEQELRAYLGKIGHDQASTNNMVEGAVSLIDDFQLNNVSVMKIAANDKNADARIVKFNQANPPAGIKSFRDFETQEVKGLANMVTKKTVECVYDLKKRSPTTVLSLAQKTWDAVRAILTDEQVDYLLNSSRFPGISYSSNKAQSIDTDHAMTMGFYELRKTVYSKDSPVTTYLFTSNGDAPSIPKGGPIFLYNDYLFFRKFLSFPVSQEVSDAITGSGLPAKYGTQLGKSSDGRWTWKTLMYTNLSYIYSKYYASKKAGTDIGTHLNEIFSLENPYKQIRIIWALRNSGNDNVPLGDNELGWGSKRYVVGLPLRTTIETYSDKQVIEKIKSWKWNDWRKHSWTMKDWKDNKTNASGLSRTTLTKDYGELFTVGFWNYNPHSENWEAKRQKMGTGCASLHLNIRPLKLDTIISSESMRYDQDTYYEIRYGIATKYEDGDYAKMYGQYTWGDDGNTFTFHSNQVLWDAITIPYMEQEKNENGTGKVDEQNNPVMKEVGVLKIICLTSKMKHNLCEKKFGALHSHNIAFMGNAVIRRQSPSSGHEDYWKQLMTVILKTSGDFSYPTMWRQAMGKIAKNAWGFPSSVKNPPAITDIEKASKKIWANSAVTSYVKKMYSSIGKAMPLLMAHRYQTQIFGNLENGCNGGSSVVDYNDPSNVLLFKAIPLMDFTDVPTSITNELAVDEEGRPATQTTFSYSHCIIDLNPDKTQYGEDLEDGKFPLRFANGVQVNATDEYKTSKIVLQRVEKISGTNSDTAEIGSSASDYEQVTNELKIRFGDKEANMLGSVTDRAIVTLSNGGTFQRRYCTGNAQGGQPPVGYDRENDFYDISDPYQIIPQQEEGSDASQLIDGNGEKKYLRNKHFFIDPFELTIAQWCYAHGWNTKELARTNLGAEKLKDMEESYWKYMKVWEPEEWEQLKETKQFVMKDEHGEPIPNPDDPKKDEDGVPIPILDESGKPKPSSVDGFGNPQLHEQPIPDEYYDKYGDIMPMQVIIHEGTEEEEKILVPTYNNGTKWVVVPELKYRNHMKESSTEGNASSDHYKWGPVIIDENGTKLPHTAGDVYELQKHYAYDYEYQCNPMKTTLNKMDELEDDDSKIQWLVDNEVYNPLEDTRPYYYATYQDVRGTAKVYDRGAEFDNYKKYIIHEKDSVLRSDMSDLQKYLEQTGQTLQEYLEQTGQTLESAAGNLNGMVEVEYIADNKGDEYQMVDRVKNGNTTSFMDLLNSKVVYQTRKRIYGWNRKLGEQYSGNTQQYLGMKNAQVLMSCTNGFPQEEHINLYKDIVNNGWVDYDPKDGGQPYHQMLMEIRDYDPVNTKFNIQYKWCSGVEAGLNFDLPSEAQWEYCCRAGSTTAFPPANDLGQNFEENDEVLDLIAWYKYKVIGKLPEPERYCTWRISKMLFGISRDKEMINNVYETTSD